MKKTEEKLRQNSSKTLLLGLWSSLKPHQSLLLDSKFIQARWKIEKEFFIQSSTIFQSDNNQNLEIAVSMPTFAKIGRLEMEMDF